MNYVSPPVDQYLKFKNRCSLLPLLPNVLHLPDPPWFSLSRLQILYSCNCHSFLQEHVVIHYLNLIWITVIRFVSIGAKFVTVVDLNGKRIEAKIRTTKCLKCIFWHLQVSIFRPKTVQMPNFSLIDTKRLQWFCWYEYILCFCYCISGSIFTDILVVAAAIFANCCVWCVNRAHLVWHQLQGLKSHIWWC